MPEQRDPRRQLDGILILFLFALFLLVSPLVDWWARPDAPWFMPFLLWAVLILLAALLQHRRRDAP